MDLRYAGGFSGESFEDAHWWMKSRFCLLDRAMKNLPARARVLEIGCGTGVNLRYLQKRYAARLEALVGTDPLAEEKSVNGIAIWKDPPKDKPFDLILLMDVLEHVDDPLSLLRELRGLLRPGGWILITVPAFQWLWTSYDEMIHHKKRYSIADLKTALRQEHFDTREIFFLFSALFPLFVMQRLLVKCALASPRTFKPASSWVNALLFGITWVEIHSWMAHNRWFGSSLVAFSQRPVQS